MFKNFVIGVASAVALDRSHSSQGVPIVVDPVLHPPTGAETEHLGLNMRVGPDEVSVAKKHHSFAQGVPIHVNPVVARATGAEAEHLGLEMRVGPDEVSVEKRQPHVRFAQAYGVPIHVNPVTMRATGAESDHLGLEMKIGPDEVSVVRKHHPSRHIVLVDRKGVPVLVDPIVAEATGANIFLVQDGVIHTPTPDCFLDGITRRTVIDLARKRGYEVVERTIMPEELGNADEVFLTGSAAEVTPVGEIDAHNYQVGSITRQMMDDYEAEVRGR